MQRHIGILGGMFDPVHLGHLKVAETALKSLQLDQVRLMPCSRPVHRDSALAENADRIAMLELAIQGSLKLCVDVRECQRSTLSYTYDSLEEMKQESPGDVYYLLMGSDTFATLESWHRWQELLGLCHIVLVNRPGYKPELSPGLLTLISVNGKHMLAELRETSSGSIYTGLDSEVDLSSTEVREALQAGQPLDGLVPDSVADYITTHLLYR